MSNTLITVLLALGVTALGLSEAKAHHGEFNAHESVKAAGVGTHAPAKPAYSPKQTKNTVLTCQENLAWVLGVSVTCKSTEN